MAQINDRDGTLCQMPHCNELDLLPTKCIKCNRVFCAAHASFDAHRCAGHHDFIVPTCPLCHQRVRVPVGESADRFVSLHMDSGCRSHLHPDTTSAAPASPSSSPSPFANIRPSAGVTVSPPRSYHTGGSGSDIRLGTGGGPSPMVNSHAARANYCSFAACSRNEAVLVLCPKCKSSFCLQHRHPIDHECRCATPPPAPVPVVADRSKPLEARSQPYDMRERQFSNTLPTAIHRSKVEHGITIAVFVERTTNVAPFFITFTRRSIIGRVLDGVCTAAGLANNNNQAATDADRWFLFCLSAPTAVAVDMALPPSTVLEDIAKDGEVFYLGKGPDLPDAVERQVHGNPITAAKVVALSSGKGTSSSSCCLS